MSLLNSFYGVSFISHKPLRKIEKSNVFLKNLFLNMFFKRRTLLCLRHSTFEKSAFSIGMLARCMQGSEKTSFCFVWVAFPC